MSLLLSTPAKMGAPNRRLNVGQFGKKLKCNYGTSKQATLRHCINPYSYPNPNPKFNPYHNPEAFHNRVTTTLTRTLNNRIRV